MGKLLSADGGKFKVETAFAGKLEIAQDKIKSFATDQAVNVALTAGSTVLGRVQTADGGIAVAAPEGPVAAPTAKVAAVWPAGGDSPETRAAKEAAAKARRKWAFEASAAIAGRTGASEKFGADLGFKATLASAQDKLVFTLAEQEATDNGVKTADRQFASVDYSTFYSPDNGWYVRTALEKDVIRDIDFRSSSSFGFSRKLLKKGPEDLEFRFGLNYLYEGYSNHTNFNSPGIDMALLHSYQFHTAKMTNVLSYTPAFKQFSNYHAHHESAFEIPLAASQWKLKLGVANDYNSMPPAGTVRLDTTYFTSLLLNWQ